MANVFYVPASRVDELMSRREELAHQLADWSQQAENVERVRVFFPAISVGDPIYPDDPVPAMPPAICSVCGKKLP